MNMVMILVVMAAVFGPGINAYPIPNNAEMLFYQCVPTPGRYLMLFFLAVQLIMLGLRMAATDFVAMIPGSWTFAMLWYTVELHICGVFGGFYTYHRNGHGWAVLIVSAISLCLNAALLVQRFVRARRARTM